jgi:hypothetical protein
MTAAMMVAYDDNIEQLFRCGGDPYADAAMEERQHPGSF